ncbi:hypothetical protein [Pseudarthrobacter sp. C4D7]|uniref:hypothetical protein n=1 Tax=Pseudarthrobacter sp. C4D7 TaxID=2735268 RepID=UPI001584BBF0|nr:hypothetical protein [Pseudarthrobacter sp. C4D7]NUT69670.1 hypothetical protein [Pseudarthrobacter sp. C4D7]
MVTHPGSFAVPSAATFGRDGAMFENLLSFVAQMSLVLWALVVLTVIIRFVGIRFYRHAARRALARITAATDIPAVAGPAAAAGPAGSAGVGVAGAAGAAAAQAAAAAVKPAIAVVPAIAAGIDPLQPANVPLPEALRNVLAANSADG